MVDCSMFLIRMSNIWTYVASHPVGRCQFVLLGKKLLV